MISHDVELAAERLRHGGLVAIPTETVYGLAADATDGSAVERIFEIKGRPTTHPLIVHVEPDASLDEWATDVPEAAATLAAACWPGPLTMLLRRGSLASDIVTGGLPTVGLRAPAHPLTQRLLRAVGRGLAAPSANRFGRVSPTTAQHVLADIGDRLDPDRDLILDGGPCEVGVESTIVDLTVDPPQVLRAGAIGAHELDRLLGTTVSAGAGPSRASGMLASHYAPDCRVIPAMDAQDAQSIAATQSSAGFRVGVLDRTDDLVGAAQQLYADLRAADAAGLDALVVVMPPATGIGHALRDRITKAAAAQGPDEPSRAG
ncbi:MAG: threonylcarbamoyl-AMP synthase [Ilumatobacter sp.]|nr:threonylcarbamoyl-AMP synthase [Ilumatobacter sp.]